MRPTTREDRDRILSFMVLLGSQPSHVLLRGTPGVGRVLALAVGLVAAAVGAVVARSALSSDRPLGIAAVSVLLFGLFQLGRALGVLSRRRRRADVWLRTATGTVIPPAYAWRAAQLTSSPQRRMLARTLRLIAERARQRPLGTYRPRLTAARERRASLEALAQKLEREAEPVTPAGMLRVVDLITAAGGPLWGTSDEALGEEIEATLAVLVPRAGSREANARAA